MTQIEKAQMIADILHCRQHYGEKKYISHVESVYQVLVRFNYIDEDLLVASWLHDTVEDTIITLKLVEKYFGKNVADIVWCVTNEGKNRREKAEKTYPKIRSNQDAIALKLADRIANVENAISTGRKDKLAMYRKEHATFSFSLRIDDTHKAMWDWLDKLFEDVKVVKSESVAVEANA